MNYFQEFKNRLTKETPKFFKRMLWLGGYLSTAAGAVLAIPGIPEKLQVIAGYVLTAGLVIAAMSKLPVKSPDYDTLDKKDENNN